MRCSGFGKSHSVGVIVENSLIRLPELGSLPSQLSVTVFHLSAAQGGMHLPSESAFVRDSVLAGEEWKVPVYVLASPSKLVKIRESYEKMGAAVVPFYLSTQDLNCARMLSLMRIEEGDKMPLYMEVVQQILRSMAMHSITGRSKKRLIKGKMIEFSPQQRMPIQLRFQLLEASCRSVRRARQKRRVLSKNIFKPGKCQLSTWLILS